MEDDSGQGLLGRFKSLLRKKGHLGDSSDLTEEIHDLMDEGQAKGLVSNEESDMVFGVLDLKETKAHSIMVPRIEISSAPVDASLGEIIRLVANCGHTRIPIHKENIDQIVGILHAKDLLKLWGEDSHSIIPSHILREPYFVPENKPLNDLLKELKEKKNHLAVVTDEYGGTAGIVTIEDILEEIVGEIQDEHDNDLPLITKLDEDRFLVDARLEANRFEEAFGIKLPEGDFESVGGFIIHMLGRIPEGGETFSFDDLDVTIQNADQRKISKIVVERKTGPSDSSS
ncbi:MAG TPA: HlyC/CorC family transporter [Desulfobacteraceae bacterium]|nr:MAG: HlyC/CorC family transporter [Deltaproteobacteria bacterium]HDZ23604.1 HlyC/CorC family transporter [Desulfobacteraceae bacterium]